MPRNRRPRERDEKLHELVTTAARLFSEEGFDQTSMTRIARAAGVTANTIYWYVDDKDALLVAALDHLLTDALQQLDEAAGTTLLDQATWTLGQLQRHRNLISVVHARSEQSEVVATWHDAFHALVDSFVMDGLARQGVEGQDLETMARLTTFAVEGLLAHPTDPDTSRTVLGLALSPRV